MVLNRPGLIAHIFHVGALESPDSALVAQPPGEGLQNRKVRGSLEIEHPAGLLCLVVLFEPDFPERLLHLAAAVVDAMRLADEGHHQIPARGLVEQHLGVAGSDDLTPAFASHLGKQAVDLALAEYLQLRVRLV